MDFPKHQLLGYVISIFAICICYFLIVFKQEESQVEIIDTSKTQETDSETISYSDTNHSENTDIIEKDGKYYIIKYHKENEELKAQLIPVDETSTDTALIN